MNTFTNHLYAFGIKVPQRQRYLLTITTVLLVVSIWYVFIYQTYAHAVYQTNLAIDQLHDKQKVLLSTEKSLSEQQNVIAEQQKEFATVFQHQAAETKPLFSLAHHNGLQMTSYAPELSMDHGWHTTTKITCNLSGTFDQILSFVDACTKQKQPIGITSFSIAKQDSGLQCTCVLEVMKIKQENKNV